MTIETGSAQNTSRPASSADGQHARNRVGSSDSQGQGSSGGFMAVLASIDNPAPAVATTPAPVDPMAQAGIARDKKPTAIDKDALGLLGASAEDASASEFELGSALDDAIGKLLQGTGSEGDVKANPLVTDAATAAAASSALDATNQLTELPPQAAALLAQSQQWASGTATKLEAGNPELKAVVASGASSGGKPATSMEAQLRAMTAENGESDTASEAIARTGKLHKELGEKTNSLQAALAATVQSAERPDARSTAMLSARAVEQLQTPLATALTMANAPVSVRREESTREHTIFKSNAPEGGSAVQTYAPTAQSIQTAGSIEPVTPTDFYVAEKVAYWINNDVQTAEMKLDGIGLDPVEVSIRMHGNEATIAFRTDEAVARSALDGASAHLKDLLQREGLVLTGVSVGTSGSGDAGDSERRSRQGLRQSVVVSQQSGVADRMAGGNRITRGALDLFV